MTWFEITKWKNRKPPSRKNSSAETNLLTMRLPLCHENQIRWWHWTLRPRARTHTELSPLFYRSFNHLSFFILYPTIHSSSSFSVRETMADRPTKDELRSSCFTGGGKTWPLTLPGRLNEILLYIDTFYFMDRTHSTFFLDKHTSHFCGFRVKASKLWIVSGCA